MTGKVRMMTGKVRMMAEHDSGQTTKVRSLWTSSTNVTNFIHSATFPTHCIFYLHLSDTRLLDCYGTGVVYFVDELWNEKIIVQRMGYYMSNN